MIAGGRRLPVVGPAPVAGSPPLFQHIAIVGLGTVGASLALAFRRAWPACLLIGVDRHDVLETAMRLHIVDVGADDLMVAGGADLVVLTGNAEENAQVLGRLAGVIQGRAIVTDTGGGAVAVARAAEALPGRLVFVGGRPVLECLPGGVESTSADLFTGRAWHLASASTAPDVMDRLRGALRAVGADPVLVPAADLATGSAPELDLP